MSRSECRKERENVRGLRRGLGGGDVRVDKVVGLMSEEEERVGM